MRPNHLTRSFLIIAPLASLLFLIVLYNSTQHEVIDTMPPHKFDTLHPVVVANLERQRRLDRERRPVVNLNPPNMGSGVPLAAKVDGVADNDFARSQAGSAEPMDLSGRGTNKTCTFRKPMFRMSVDGRRCIIPFKIYDTWHTDCSSGVCAVRTDVLSRSLELANCTEKSYISGPLKCTKVAYTKDQCSTGEKVSGQPSCTSLIPKDASAMCTCTGAGSEVEHHLHCSHYETSCDDVCHEIALNALSSGHSLELGANDYIPAVVEAASTLSNKYKPDEANLQSWSLFANELPAHEEAIKDWCGRGIAIMAGSVNTLPQALATVSFLRGHLKSNMPVEVWQTSDEASSFSTQFTTSLAQLNVVIRTLPDHVKSATANEMFALKPAVVLASSFDEVLLLDADTIPLVDPSEIFRIRTADESAVFWPDYWTLLYDAKIWDAIGGWPFSSHHVPSQDSGLMVVCKSCGGWKPLAVAFHFNYHNSIYYNAIYMGHWQEKQCRGGKCTRGHDVPGMGDKDTFQIAWLAFKLPYKMMPPASIAGTMLPRRRLVCGSSFIHRNSQRQAIALHHNSNKWWWKDFITGRWTAWHTGLLLTHVATFQNDSSAYFADGMNDWRSITYSTRYDAGRQQPPPSSRWCIIYKGAVTNTRIIDDIGWDIEKVLVDYYTRLYSAPWMVEWATLSSGSTQLAECVRKSRWESVEWLSKASDEDLRNTVIAHLTFLGFGKVPYLQSHSDFSLMRLCQQAIMQITQ